MEGRNLKLGKRKAEAVEGEVGAGKEAAVTRTLLYGYVLRESVRWACKIIAFSSWI